MTMITPWEGTAAEWDAVVAADQFFARILGDRAEAVVGKNDHAFRVRDRHDGMLIERGLQVVDFLERGFQLRFHGVRRTTHGNRGSAEKHVRPAVSRCDSWR
jgi:hypothetical protein